ncbi:uncharacterized protein LOC144937136 isoform X1 [Lampetra fluviatilis]
MATAQECTSREEMTKFWKEHSQEATLEQMMLDSKASTLAEEEKPEILSLLPNLDGTDILELGAGIGRFTGHLAKIANHVTAVDFMETFIAKNKEDNGHRGNLTFLQADVTQLDFPANSFDVIFSNWLFMYLTDEELLVLTRKMLTWLRPGCHLFFRESCFTQSGDGHRNFNPTKYRKPAAYNHLLQLGSLPVPNKEDKSVGFEIVMSKSVQTYIKFKNNKNQMCWLMQKVQRDQAANYGFATFQQFLDTQQYSSRSILRYEKIFGHGFVSTGGRQTTEEFLAMLGLRQGQKVLDVGCGIGGGDFLMSKIYGVEVLGVDLSSNMVAIAMERAVEEDAPLVQFEISDATKRVFPENSFDVVYSRDTILHIADKVGLFKSFYAWLKPGGKLLITDYCCGAKPWSGLFEAYVKDRGYILYEVSQYGKFLEAAGFVRVKAEDRTNHFVEVAKQEVARTELVKDEFVKEFSQDDYDYIVKGWQEKLYRCELGDQKWGLFYAEKATDPACY